MVLANTYNIFNNYVQPQSVASNDGPVNQDMSPQQNATAVWMAFAQRYSQPPPWSPLPPPPPSAPWVAWALDCTSTSVWTIYCMDYCIDYMQLCIWTVVLYRLLYGVVSSIVWICINYCMDLIRVLYGFVSNIIGICIDIYMNCICHCIFDWGYIYTIC